jgi:hypothetical protein
MKWWKEYKKRKYNGLKAEYEEILRQCQWHASMSIWEKDRLAKLKRKMGFYEQV